MNQNNLAAGPGLLQFKGNGTAAEGFLFSTQAAAQLPFAVKRVFWLQQVPEDFTRGHHAHYTTQEVLVALRGSIRVSTQSQGGQHDFTLNNPQTGLYIPARCWVTLAFSPEALLLCLASTDYNPADYIRNYTEFQRICLASGE